MSTYYSHGPCGCSSETCRKYGCQARRQDSQYSPGHMSYMGGAGGAAGGNDYLLRQILAELKALREAMANKCSP